MVGRQAVRLEQAPSDGGVPDEVIDSPAGYFPVPATSQLDGPALGSRALWQLALLEM
jgi:hypothetical protein